MSEIKKQTVGRKACQNSTQMLIIWRAGDSDIQRQLNKIINTGETKTDYIRRLIRQDIKREERNRARRAKK